MKKESSFVIALKNIPAVLKGFPKNLVYFWKTPVKSSSEVEERKKDVTSLLFVFIGLIVVSFLLGPIPIVGAIFGIFSCVGVIGIIYCILLFMVMNKAKKRFACLECEKCKTVIEYSDNVQFEVLEQKISIDSSVSDRKDKNGVPTNSTIITTGRQRTKMRVTCTCQNCGETRIFEKDFVTAVCKISQIVDYVLSGAQKITDERRMAEFMKNELPNMTSVQPQSKARAASNQLHLDYYETPEEAVERFFDSNALQMADF